MRRGSARRFSVPIWLWLDVQVDIVTIWQRSWLGGQIGLAQASVVLVTVEVKEDSFAREEAVLETIIDAVDELVNATGDLELNGPEDRSLELLWEDLVERNGFLSFALESFEVGEVDLAGELALKDLLIIEAESIGVCFKIGKDLAGGRKIEDVRVVRACRGGRRERLDGLSLDERHVDCVSSSAQLDESSVCWGA